MWSQDCKLARSRSCDAADCRYRDCVITLAIATHKGGSGKSTIAVNLASELRARGHRVLVVDADEQATAISWAGAASAAGHDTPAVIGLGDNLRRQLPEIGASYEFVVVDCPGRGGRRQAAAILAADLVLLPCTPSVADAWILGETIDVVEEARALRPEILAGIVLNRADRTIVTAQARASLAETSIPLLKATLGDRVAFREAMAAGQGVTEYARSSAAADEMRALADEVVAMLAAA